MKHCNHNNCGNKICVSAIDGNSKINISGDKSRYYAELAEQFKNQAKSYSETTQYYAEQNSDVTLEYVNSIDATLRNLIDGKQNAGNYALVSSVPTKTSDLTNNSGFITASSVGNGTITLTQDGVTVGSFTSNQSGNSTLNINLSEKADKISLHSLKGYKDDGEILTDTEGFGDVFHYAHSTFDATKFTVIGSPDVTNEGIGSGFDANNYLTATITASSNFDIISKIYYTAANFPQTAWYISDYYELLINSSNQLILRVPTDTGTYYRQAMIYTPNNEGYIYVKYSVKNSSIHCFTSTDGTNWTERTNGPIAAYSTCDISNTSISVGCCSGNQYPFLGKIDLKCFSITEAGIAVFNANKTTTDTILNNYTVVGTPTVSPDGIVSNFSDNNYIQVPTIDFTNPWSISFDTKITLQSSGTRSIISANGSNCFSINLNSNGTTSWYLSGNGSSWDIASGTGGTKTIQTNTNTNLTIGWDGSNYYYAVNGSRENIIASSTALYNGTTEINIGANRQGTAGISGMVDLNTFKAYVSGNLSYQACLKIPYTESITGSKVAGILYRGRISDMYNQFGYAPYYTIDESLNNFTIPMGEIYGMIDKSAKNIAKEHPQIVEIYQSGMNGYVIYSNKQCWQWGEYATTALTDTIEFMKEFANTNYVFISSQATASANQHTSYNTVTGTKTVSSIQVFGLTTGCTQSWIAMGFVN